MKIKELIAELQKYEENTVVKTWTTYEDDLYTMPIDSIKKEQYGDDAIILEASPF